MNSITAPAVRTGIQATVTEGLIRLVEVVPDPDLVIDTPDRAIILVVGVAAVTAVQHVIEAKLGRRLLGTPTT